MGRRRARVPPARIPDPHEASAVNPSHGESVEGTFSCHSMNIKQFLSVSALALGTTAFAAGSHGDEAKPRHGGVVTVVKDVSYELVASKQSMSLHVSDHGKVPDLNGATAKLTLLSGTSKQEVDLHPNGSALAATGTFAADAGTKAVAQVTLKGKPVQSVRFTLK